MSYLTLFYTYITNKFKIILRNSFSTGNSELHIPFNILELVHPCEWDKLSWKCVVDLNWLDFVLGNEKNVLLMRLNSICSKHNLDPRMSNKSFDNAGRCKDVNAGAIEQNNDLINSLSANIRSMVENDDGTYTLPEMGTRYRLETIRFEESNHSHLALRLVKN
jgi:hypothetical protein